MIIKFNFAGEKQLIKIFKKKLHSLIMFFKYSINSKFEKIFFIHLFPKSNINNFYASFKFNIQK